MAAINRTTLLATVKEIEENIARDDLVQAETRITELYKDTLTFVRAPQHSSDIPFSLTNKVIEVLISEDIQFSDPLKRGLSQTAALLTEHIRFICKKEKRSIYPHTRVRLLSELGVLLLTFPKKEKVAAFAVRCSFEAIHGVNPGQGKWLELAKKHGKDLFTAGASSLGGQSGGAIAGATADVVFSICKEKTNSSYLTLLEMKQQFLPIDNLEKLQTNAIQTELSKYHQKPKYALCLAEIFHRIMQYGSEDLKEAIFSSEQEKIPGRESFRSLLTQTDRGPNLCNIAGLNEHKKKYWKGRLRSVEALICLSKEEGPYQMRSIAILTFRLAVERDETIAKCLLHTYKQEPKERQTLWKGYLRYLNADDIRTKDRSLKKGLEMERVEARKLFEKQEASLQGEYEQWGHQGESGGSLKDEGPNTKVIAIEKELEALKSQEEREETWFIEQEKAVDIIQQKRLTLLKGVASGG